MESLDQGSLIYSIRSKKYNNLHCFGIIITASCDIAQNKVSKIYYLTAVNVTDWLCIDEVFLGLFKSQINNKRNNFFDSATKNGLNANLLESFTYEEAVCVIESEVKNIKSRKQLLKQYDTFYKYCKNKYTLQDKKEIIHEDHVMVEEYIKKIGKGDINHFYFLPCSKYKNDVEDNTSGLIVDFQEIEYMSILDASNIVNPGIDNLIITDYSTDEQERYRKNFWLDEEKAFVKIEGKICSPWREHLMQRFSNCFARIGLDGATDSDYSKIVSKI